MADRLEELKKLRDQLQVVVTGLENYRGNNPKLVVANHSCLMDIFYLPSALPEKVVSLISPRLIYKKDVERQQMIEKYLYAMPIEAHGGATYANICLQQAAKMIKNGCSACIFPEGAYVEDNTQIYRGRTGVARILFQALMEGVKVDYIPVAIQYRNQINDLDSYNATDHQVHVSILESLSYEEEFEQFLHSSTKEQKNTLLHRVTDKGLQSISKTMSLKYNLDYISLYPKGNVIFRDGSTVAMPEATKNEWTILYEEQLQMRADDICNLVKRK